MADDRLNNLRVALVHDFFYVRGGAERVVEQIINVFPQCDVFALFDFLPHEERDFLRGKPVKTSFLQKLPLVRKHHRSFLPLMPLAIEQLDVSAYDLVISSSYVVAKGVITGPDQLHVCYCHSPVRFAWDQHHQYLSEAGIGFGPSGLVKRAILHYVRTWDARTSLGVDRFIANSEFVRRRIDKTYRRDATVIHPPVDTETFVPPCKQGLSGSIPPSHKSIRPDPHDAEANGVAVPCKPRDCEPYQMDDQPNSGTDRVKVREQLVIHSAVLGCRGGEVEQAETTRDEDRCEGHLPNDDYYLAASRLVPQKRIDLIIEAFAQMPDRKLVVVGDGPQRQRLTAMATPNVRLVGYQTEPQLVRWMQHAKAFVFAAEEDFGITPVEALACATPVLAYGRGGACETVVDGVNGLFFDQQTVAGIAAAVDRFEALGRDHFDVHADAERYGCDRFREELAKLVRDALG